MYVVTYKGRFGFIKPWTAVRDGETFSQQFLTPSIIEGIEKKLFPELLGTVGIQKILRHKLKYEGMDSQQEVTQSRGWHYTKRTFRRDRSVLRRSVLLLPTLQLAFGNEEDAITASKQHICLCRNEDILLPEPTISNMQDAEFDQLPGFELRFGQSGQSFLVGYNRFDDNRPMYGWLEYNGQSLMEKQRDEETKGRPVAGVQRTIFNPTPKQMMNAHPEILAKSEQNGHISLYQHLKNVADITAVVARHSELDPEIAAEGALLHDIGKASPVFQQSLSPAYRAKPGAVFRHEIASLFFLSLVKEEHRGAVIDMIVAHHKSVYKDVRELGLIDLDDTTDSFTIHSKGFNEWCPTALDILESLGMDTHPISLDEARDNYEEAIDYCKAKKRGCSTWRGVLMASDHMASAMETKSEMPINKLFINPDLSFYNRPSPLYPLSMISTDSPKRHTLVTAPTGAGKTDFLLRRCRGRVFYTLPFQASINAMYDRIKEDLSDTEAQIYLLHAASNLKVREGKVEESIMQRHVGASVKVLTPHQMASIVFGIKGYEAMAMDLKGCDVILDEIHTYSDVIQSIVLRIIEILVALDCRIHVGTATMPSALYHKILGLLGGSEAVYEVKLDIQTLNTFNRHQIYKLAEKEDAYPVIAAAVEKKSKVLIVCNQVKRAQDFFEEIEELYPNIKKMLIHSRYKRKDRARLESDLRMKFNALEDAPCIVVSTQVVEVSLDISFDVMITECAPIDALTQRFGRINRKRAQNTIGHYKPIYVIAPPNDETEARPYGLDTLETTFNVLPDHGEVMEENKVQEMIDTVYPNIALTNIDYTGVAFLNGGWQLKELCHRPKSALLETLDINSAVCITEEDKEAYLLEDPTKRTELEIPVSYHSVAHRHLEQLNKGMRPFVIPNKGYDTEKGLIVDLCKVEHYQSFEIL